MLISRDPRDSSSTSNESSGASAFSALHSNPANTFSSPSSPTHSTSNSSSRSHTSHLTSSHASTMDSHATAHTQDTETASTFDEMDGASCEYDPDAWFARFHDEDEAEENFDSHVLPTIAQLDKAANVPVYDADGVSRPFKSLYQGNEHIGQRQLIIFIRHFYCFVSRPTAMFAPTCIRLHFGISKSNTMPGLPILSSEAHRNDNTIRLLLSTNTNYNHRHRLRNAALDTSLHH
jgi:hypothetical protein